MGFFSNLFTNLLDNNFVHGMDRYMQNNPGALQTMLGMGARAFAPEGTWQNSLGMLGSALGQADILDEQRKQSELKNNALLGKTKQIGPDAGYNTLTMDKKRKKLTNKIDNPLVSSLG